MTLLSVNLHLWWMGGWYLPLSVSYWCCLCHLIQLVMTNAWSHFSAGSVDEVLFGLTTTPPDYHHQIDEMKTFLCSDQLSL